MRRRSLPLGIDLGEARIRVVALSAGSDGSLRLEDACGVDVVDDRRLALASALEALKSNERRCVAMIRSGDARLRSVQMPAMPRTDAERAVRFEGVALFESTGGENSAEPIAVRSVSFAPATDGSRQTLIAAAPVRKVQTTLALLKGAGLRPVWIDHEACALVRAGSVPLVDIGLTCTTLITLARGSPSVRTIPFGGAIFTEELARELGTSYENAESRKRAIGLGGAASGAVDAFAGALAEEVQAARGAGELDSRLFVCGNGARLADVGERLAAELDMRIEPVSLAKFIETDLPPQAERSGAMDWFGAIAAALPRAESAAWTG